MMPPWDEFLESHHGAPQPTAHFCRVRIAKALPTFLFPSRGFLPIQFDTSCDPTCHLSVSPRGSGL